MDQSRFARALTEALCAATLVTVGVTLASTFLRERWVASAVGFTFLGATWLLVFRRDDAVVEHAGLAFSSVVLPGRLDAARIARDVGVAVAWALLLGLVFFGPFYLGFRAYSHWVWHLGVPPLTRLRPAVALDEIVGQIAIIALPEEVFYRGYLQTRLDDVWPPRTRVLGAVVGPSLIVTSVIFAIGHIATIHDPGRLAVFFPSLLFGWLRARTGGVGAPIAFHALCNVFSATLLALYGPR